MVRIKNIPDTITSIDPDMWVAVDRDDDAEESGKARASTLSAFVNDQLSPILDITEGVGVTIDKTDPQNPVITADQGGGNMFSEVYDPQGISNDAFARENHTGTQPISATEGLQEALDGKLSEVPDGSVTFPKTDGTFATITARDVTELLSGVIAGKTLSYTAGEGNLVVAPGQIVQTAKEGFSYEVRANNAVDWSVELLNGVKLKVLALPSGKFNAASWGLLGNYDVNTDLGFDNYQPLQKCFDEIYLSGGGDVIIPNGRYVFRSQVKFRGGVTVEIMSDAVLYRGHDFTMFAVVDSAFPETQSMGYDGASDIHWSGGTIDLNSVNYPDAANGFAMAHGRNYSFRNMIVKDVFATHALDVNGIDGLLVENVRFEGWFEDTGSGPGHFPGRIREAVQITYASGDWTPTKNARFINCYVGPSSTPGSLPWPCGFGNHGWHTPQFTSNITIEDCVFEDCLYAAIRPYSFDNVTIKNNKFLRCYRDVFLSNARMNSADTIDADGVQQYQAESNRNIWIVDNESRSCGIAFVQGVSEVGDQAVMDGYTIPYMRNIHIRGNRVYNCGGTTGGAINLQWAIGAWIENNYIDECFRGVYAGFLQKSHVCGNHITQASDSAIWLLEPSSGLSGNWVWAQGAGRNGRNILSENIIDFAGLHGLRIADTIGSKVIDNIVGPCSRAADNVSDAIRIEGTSSKVHVAGNSTPLLTGNGHRYGLVIGGTTSLVTVGDNHLEGKTGLRTVSLSAIRGESAILRDFADESAAISGGVPLDGKYRTGSTVRIRT